MADRADAGTGIADCDEYLAILTRCMHLPGNYDTPEGRLAVEEARRMIIEHLENAPSDQVAESCRNLTQMIYTRCDVESYRRSQSHK